MSEQDWEGIVGNVINHRTVGPHRAWCKCGEWCYPDSHCTCCMETEGYEVRWSHPDNPLMTRAEWEASVNYNYILDWAIDVGGLNYRPDMQEIKDVVATALNVEEDS